MEVIGIVVVLAVLIVGMFVFVGPLLVAGRDVAATERTLPNSEGGTLVAVAGFF